MAAPVTRGDSPENATKLSFEVKLAQALAGNEKKKRDRAVKKLEKWLVARAQSKQNPLPREEMMKVWKGLHYCMWMSDKPLVQEELAERISGLVHVFQFPEMMITWLGVFLETQAREWNGIDRLRLDKFMMLIRYVMRQSLGYMKRLSWPDALIQQWLDTVFGLVSGVETRAPDGLKMHVVDLMHGELTLVGADDLTSEKIGAFLHPFCELLSKTKSVCVSKRLVNSLFLQIIKTSPVGAEEEEEEEERTMLEVDYQALADDLFKLGSAKECTGANRTTVYNLVKKFRDLSSGIFPVEEISSGEEEELTPQQIKQAARQLQNFEAGLAKKKKKKEKKKKSRKANEKADYEEEDDDTSEPETDHIELPKTKKNPQKRKMKESPPDDGSGDASPTKKRKKSKKKKNAQEPLENIDMDMSALQIGLDKSENRSETPKMKKKKNKQVSPDMANNSDSLPEFPGSNQKKKKKGNTDAETLISNELSPKLDNTGSGDAKTKKKKKKKVNENSGDVFMNRLLKMTSPEMNFIETEIPKAKFFKKASRESTTSPEERKTPKIKTRGTPCTPLSVKRVMFQMHRNQAQEFKESLTLSPVVPFNPKRIPEQGILKSSPSTPSTPKVKVTISPKVKGSPKVRTPKIRKPPASFTPTLIPAPDSKKKKKRKTSL